MRDLWDLGAGRQHQVQIKFSSEDLNDYLLWHLGLLHLAAWMWDAEAVTTSSAAATKALASMPVTASMTIPFSSKTVTLAKYKCSCYNT